MKTLMRLLLVASGACLSITAITATIAVSQVNPVQAKSTRAQREEQQKITNDQNVGLVGGPLDELANRANQPVPAYRREQMDRWEALNMDRKKSVKLLKKMLAAPPEYQEKYAGLLKNEKMRLIRLYPDKNCDLLYAREVSVDDIERCKDAVPYAGGGSKYSFEKKSNAEWGDIHFIDNKLVTGGFSTSIIGKLGDGDLQDVNLTSGAVKFLTELKPTATRTEFKEQNKTFEKGIIFNGFYYSLSVSPELNSVYVLRSITYTSGIESTMRKGTVFYKTSNKLRTTDDITVAFKIVGQEKDGSVILLWKELK